MDYVIQKATPSKKIGSRGRPVAFDRSDVIERSVDLFWSNGFDGSSLDDLVGGLGISRSTLYNSFGGKDGLYQAALEQYLDRVERVIVEPLRTGSEGLADVVAFIDRVEAVLTSVEMPAGCLVLNDMAAPRNVAAVDRYLAGLRDAVHSGLHRAATLGEIDASTVAARTAVVLATVIAANHVSAAELHVGATELTNGLRTVVRQWAHT